jgi:hypothetical protein
MKNPEKMYEDGTYGDTSSWHLSPQVLGTSRLLPARKLIRNKEHSHRTKNTHITDKKLSNSDRKTKEEHSFHSARNSISAFFTPGKLL